MLVWTVLFFLTISYAYVRHPIKRFARNVVLFEKHSVKRPKESDASTFAGVQFHSPLSSSLKRLNIAELPSPIQEVAISPLSRGESYFLHAPTGTGKTFAYLLPLLKQLYEAKKRNPLSALIVVPTKELASQVLFDIEQLTNFDTSMYVMLDSPDTPLLSMTSTSAYTLDPALNKPLWIATAAHLQKFIELHTQSNTTFQQEEGITLMETFQHIRHLVLDEMDRTFPVPFNFQDMQSHPLSPLQHCLNFLYKCKYIARKHEAAQSKHPLHALAKDVWKDLLKDVQMIGTSATINRLIRREWNRFNHITSYEELLDSTQRKYTNDMLPVLRPVLYDQHTVLEKTSTSSSSSPILANLTDTHSRHVYIPSGIHHMIQLDPSLAIYESKLGALQGNIPVLKSMKRSRERHHLSYKHLIRQHEYKHYPLQAQLKILSSHFLQPAKQWMRVVTHPPSNNLSPKRMQYRIEKERTSQQPKTFDVQHHIRRCIVFVPELRHLPNAIRYLQEELDYQYVYTLAMFQEELEEEQKLDKIQARKDAEAEDELALNPMQSVTRTMQELEKEQEQAEEHLDETITADEGEVQVNDYMIKDSVTLPLPTDEPEIFVLPMVSGSRGLHIPHVDTVFVLHMPKSLDAYLHIAGRTNRMDCYSNTNDSSTSTSAASSFGEIEKKVITFASAGDHRRMSGWETPLQIAFQVLPPTTSNNNNNPGNTATQSSSPPPFSSYHKKR